jgi:hypothetical protein
MAKFYSELDDQLCEFIDRQQIFFTASAPTEGRINLSPKGMDTFRCLNHQQVAYLDLTGSGNETAAHLHQNGRITVMFCSFDQNPLILRLYGPGQRQIIVVNIESVQTSCGFGVPMFEQQQERSTLSDWAAKKGIEGVREYQIQKNQTSIDGLPTHLTQ